MLALDRLTQTLWEYLGHPDDEPPERRRILYAIVALRLGLGPMFLLRGWGAAFAPTPTAFAARLGDPAIWGLGSETGRDLVLFLLGCTELLVGALLIAGAFTRVSAVIGAVLVVLYLAIGNDNYVNPSVPFPGIHCIDYCGPVPMHYPFTDAIVAGALIAALGGLLLVILCGSPFLSADRFIDKVEEEERDRLPAILPGLATLTPCFPRLGVAAGLGWLAIVFPPVELLVAAKLAAIILAPLLAFGLATRVTGLLGAGVLVLLVGLGFLGSDTVWLLLGPLAVGVALALTGGGRLSLDHRRARRHVDPDRYQWPAGMPEEPPQRQSLAIGRRLDD